MPFTPFHFGPGLLLKGAAPTRFSFIGYAAAQVMIDVESGYFLLTGQYPVHRTLHTFAAGGLIGAVSGFVAGGLTRSVLGDGAAPALRAEVRTAPALVGGVIGGLAHSVLDGIMHPDIRPFRPFSEATPLWGLLDLSGLLLFCVLTGVVGLVLLARRRLWAPSGPDR